MTVKELKSKLENVADETIVCVFDDEYLIREVEQSVLHQTMKRILNESNIIYDQDIVGEKNVLIILLST